MKNGLRSLVDWVSVTFTMIGSVNNIFDIIGIPESEFLEMPKGLHGYAKQKACGNIRILYDGNDGMGIHLQMSGQGCREFENYYSLGWIEFFKSCISANGQFSRFDGAIDDIRYNGDKPAFTLQQIIRKVKRNECRSKFQKSKRIETIKIDGGRSEGQTIYFGSDSSEIQQIIYEKNFERENEGKELEEHLTAWNRFEIRMRNERAQKAVLNLINGMELGELLLGVINNYIEIVDRTTDSNKSRWPRTKWWNDFLGDVSKLKLTMVADDKTVEENKAWLDKQVSPSLAMQFLANGSSLEWLYEMLHDGLERLTDVHIQKADEHIKWLSEEKEKWEQARKKIGLLPTINNYPINK